MRPDSPARSVRRVAFVQEDHAARAGAAHSRPSRRSRRCRAGSSAIDPATKPAKSAASQPLVEPPVVGMRRSTARSAASHHPVTDVDAPMKSWSAVVLRRRRRHLREDRQVLARFVRTPGSARCSRRRDHAVVHILRRGVVTGEAGEAVPAVRRRRGWNGDQMLANPFDRDGSGELPRVVVVRVCRSRRQTRTTTTPPSSPQPSRSKAFVSIWSLFRTSPRRTVGIASPGSRGTTPRLSTCTTAWSPPATACASRSSATKRARISRFSPRSAPPPAKDYLRSSDFIGSSTSVTGDVTALLRAVDLRIPSTGGSTSGCEAADFVGFVGRFDRLDAARHLQLRGEGRERAGRRSDRRDPLQRRKRARSDGPGQSGRNRHVDPRRLRHVRRRESSSRTA